MDMQFNDESGFGSDFSNGHGAPKGAVPIPLSCNGDDGHKNGSSFPYQKMKSLDARKPNLSKGLCSESETTHLEIKLK